MIPSWILDILAAIMLVVAAVSAGRLTAARAWPHRAGRAALADIDVAHLLMAIAMAGMPLAGCAQPSGWYPALDDRILFPQFKSGRTLIASNPCDMRYTAQPGK